MANLGHYNSMDVTLMVKGVHITGLSEDMVQCEKDEDLREGSWGGQGDIVVTEKNHTGGKITITVQPTCPQKSHLMSCVREKEPFPIWYINESLGERVGGELCLALSYPAVGRGAEAEDLEFVFAVFDYTVDLDSTDHGHEIRI